MRPKHSFLRAVAWFCVALLAYLSLIPGDLQVRTGAPAPLEHTVAYFGTAVLLSLAYPTKLGLIAAALVSYGGVLELLQTLSPHRHAKLLDACASGAGALLGVLAVALIMSRRDDRA
jgi:VanZ family protein